MISNLPVVFAPSSSLAGWLGSHVEAAFAFLPGLLAGMPL